MGEILSCLQALHPDGSTVAGAGRRGAFHAWRVPYSPASSAPAGARTNGVDALAEGPEVCPFNQHLRETEGKSMYLIEISLL